MLIPDLQEFAVRLFLPFRLNFDSFPGTQAIWEQLQLSGEWVKPITPPDAASELDHSLCQSLFGQKADGFLYCQGSNESTQKWTSVFSWNGPYALEFYLNPQAVGALAFTCHAEANGAPMPSWHQFREQLHAQSKDSRLRAEAKRWLDELLPDCCKGSVTWERRFVLSAIRFDTLRPFDREDAQQADWAKHLIGTALALKPSETTIAIYENLASEVFGPYHQACVASHGAAHFFANSREPASNPNRITWAVTSYSWITIHEVLFRAASINLQASSRAKLERFLSLPRDAPDLKSWWTRLREGLLGDHPAPTSSLAREMDRMHSEVSRFLLFGEAVLVAKWQPMVQYDAMLRRALSAAQASGRLRDLLADMHRALAAKEQSSSMNSLLQLQHGVEFIEPIFLAYYMLMIAEHLAQQFHVAKEWELIGVLAAILLGLLCRAFFANTKQLLFTFVLFLVFWLLLAHLYPVPLPPAAQAPNTPKSLH